MTDAEHDAKILLMGRWGDDDRICAYRAALAAARSERDAKEAQRERAQKWLDKFQGLAAGETVKALAEKARAEEALHALVALQRGMAQIADGLAFLPLGDLDGRHAIEAFRLIGMLQTASRASATALALCCDGQAEKP